MSRITGDGQKQIIEALAAKGFEVLTARGGFFIRGRGFVTYSQAKSLAELRGKLTDREAPQPRVGAYGEWAFVAAINRCL